MATKLKAGEVRKIYSELKAFLNDGMPKSKLRELDYVWSYDAAIYVHYQNVIAVSFANGFGVRINAVKHTFRMVEFDMCNNLGTGDTGHKINQRDWCDNGGVSRSVLAHSTFNTMHMEYVDSTRKLGDDDTKPDTYKYTDNEDLLTKLTEIADISITFSKQVFLDVFCFFDCEICAGLHKAEDFYNKVERDPLYYADLTTDGYKYSSYVAKAYWLSTLAKYMLNGDL